MRFVTLITLQDGSGTERFVYGHALPHRPELREASEWRSIQRKVVEKVSLTRYTAVLGQGAFEELHTALLSGTMLRLPLSGGLESAIRSRPIMVARGPVRASRAEFERLTPLVHEDEDHCTLWSSQPVAVYDDLLSLVTGPPEQRAVNLRRFATVLRELVPIPFDAGQLWRVGCFEVIEAVVPGGGDDDVRIDLLNSRSPLGLRIELRGAVAEIATHVRVRGDGGVGGIASQRFVDRLIAISAPHVFEVDLPEAGVNFRIDVFGGADGHCVCSRFLSRVRGMAISVSIGRDEGLLERLPPELAEHVRAGTSHRHPGVSRVDPWATAQATAAAFERRDFPALSPGFYMVYEPDAQRDFVRAFLASAGTGAITIADPYFDDKALRLHLIGRRDITADLIIVTSLDDDTRALASATSNRESESGQSLPPAQPRTSPSLRDLLGAADENHNDLPRRLRIINVASVDAGNGHQFHDRFIRVRSETNDILWWLGNSLNSAGSRKYPLFAAEVSGQQRIDFAEYVRLLGEGKVRGRPEAMATTHFTNRWSYEPAAPVTPQNSELQAFLGWQQVLANLGSVAGVRVDTSDEAATDKSIEALRRSGVLADHRPHPSWGVPDERRADVAAYLSSVLTLPQDHSVLILALATWADHGGLQGSDLPMNCRTVARVLGIAHNEIEQLAGSDPLSWSFTSCTFEDAIDRALMSLERIDLHSVRAPLLKYVRDIAIANAPNLYWCFVVRSRRDRVYASVTDSYDWSAIRSAEPTALRGDVTLIAQVVAVLLVSREMERARELIRAANLPPLDCAFGLSKVLVSERRSLEETWPLLEATWADTEISDVVAERLERLLDRHPQDLELVARLADTHPEPPQLRGLLIAAWTRHLPFNGQPAPEGRGSSSAYRAAQPLMACIVTRQFLAFELPAQKFNAEVLRRLNLIELTRPFAREIDYQAWQDAGAAGARVLFVGCQLAEVCADGAALLTPLKNLATQLNHNRWGEASHDLVAVNAAVALARTAKAHPAFRPVADEVLVAPTIPDALRFAVALWLDDDAASIEARTGDIDVNAALRPFLPGQRAEVVAAFIRRLEAVAPSASIIARLVDLEAAQSRELS